MVYNIKTFQGFCEANTIHALTVHTHCYKFVCFFFSILKLHFKVQDNQLYTYSKYVITVWDLIAPFEISNVKSCNSWSENLSEAHFKLGLL